MNSATDQWSAFFQSFAALARELDLNVAITYLEAHQPMPRNTVSVISRHGEVLLNYSKFFICDFGKGELLKSNPNSHDVGCDVNCSPWRGVRRLHGCWCPRRSEERCHDLR